MRSRLVVLASGEGTLLQHLIDACQPARSARRSSQSALTGTGRGRCGRAEAAGITTFVCRVGDYAERADWDKALTQTCAGYRPDLVVSAGFMKLLGPAFLDEFSGRCINSHPALLPSFPGMHGVSDALAYGVKVTGCTVFLVDAGAGQRAGDSAAGRAGARRRRRGVADGADQVGRARAARGHGRRDAGRRLVGHRPDGQAGYLTTGHITAGADHREREREPGCHQRAIVSVYDKTGLDQLARTLHEAGVEIVSTGSTAATIGAAGIPVTPSRR